MVDKTKAAVTVKPVRDVDRLVGERVRTLRQNAGISQSVLGERAGVTFQQIQKYEKGSNRIGASRLVQIADALSVPVSVFFEALPRAGETSADVDLREYVRIKDPNLRKRIRALVDAVTRKEGSTEES